MDNSNPCLAQENGGLINTNRVAFHALYIVYPTLYSYRVYYTLLNNVPYLLHGRRPDTHNLLMMKLYYHEYHKVILGLNCELQNVTSGLMLIN